MALYKFRIIIIIIIIMFYVYKIQCPLALSIMPPCHTPPSLAVSQYLYYYYYVIVCQSWMTFINRDGLLLA